MQILTTPRLTIRPFVMADLENVYQLLDIALGEADFGSEGRLSLAERRTWLEWTILGYAQIEHLYQPPYGDRAVTLKSSDELVGAVGFVPCLEPFEQLPGLGAGAAPTAPVRYTAEVGLFYAIAPAHQRQGYASEVAGAMVAYAFNTLNLKRIVATTTYDNGASIGVMRRLGMRIERNPQPTPAWMQVVGILEHG
jgi:[ribosomal protein S5]-alanine N-acetyltransferase